MMKLITLNTHSLLEENYEKKLYDFVDVIIKEQPDVFALQEVNQSLLMPMIECKDMFGYVKPSGMEVYIREGNHALSVASLLKEAGAQYYWTWVPIKKGYETFEEGLALFSKSPITETREFYVSKTNDYNNWRSRMLLGIKNEKYVDTWFFSAHFGWWDDEKDPFYYQWDVANFTIEELILDDLCYVMGDFNSPDKVSNQGFDYVKNTGWYDTWEIAEQKDSGLTVGHVIDGWHDRVEIESVYANGMRLDYIWCNKKVSVKTSEVIFNGKKYNIVSDHYGVMTEIDNK